jgi:hypothetical protein
MIELVQLGAVVEDTYLSVLSKRKSGFGKEKLPDLLTICRYHNLTGLPISSMGFPLMS